MCHLLLRGFQFFTFHILLELRANLTVRRHISVFFNFFGDIGDTGVMRREKGGKREKKKMDESKRRGRRKVGSWRR